MRKEEPSNNVKLAATNALLNSLEFTKANFDKEVLRSPLSRLQGPASLNLTLALSLCRRRDTSSCRSCVKPRSVQTPGCVSFPHTHVRQMLIRLITSVCFCPAVGESGCVAEPGEGHVLVLPVHGDVHGPRAVCCKFSEERQGCLILSD